MAHTESTKGIGHFPQLSFYIVRANSKTTIINLRIGVEFPNHSQL
jgi:hypothetical protein